MERVETLLKKLQDQLAQHASPGQMLLTVQMLQAELLLLQGSASPAASETDIAITVSGMMAPPLSKPVTDD
ncbi:MAG TPA: hypothetical protein PKG65_13660, partial [Ferruginibacter sp.]|nr:hypothetical protein [Ferruginibacter sp.]